MADEDHISALMDNPPPDDAAEDSSGDQEQEVPDTTHEEKSAQSDESQSQGESREEGEQRTKMVPHQALHEERRRRQELQAEIQELKARMQQYEKLREELQELRTAAQRQQDQAAEEDEAKLFEEDPIEALRRRTERMQKMLEETKGQAEQIQTMTKEQAEQQRFLQEVHTRVQAQAAEFQREHPDYTEALNYLVEMRTRELQAIGITDPAEINEVLQQEALALSMNAIQRGQNAAEAVYNLAQVRGWSPKQQQSVDDKLDKLERGQKAARTLSGGSSGKTEDLTLADIENMSDEEFDKFWEQMARAQN